MIIAKINKQNFIHVATAQPQQESMLNIKKNWHTYMPINEAFRIACASWYQGNDKVFTSGKAGVQFCSLLLGDTIKATIQLPRKEIVIKYVEPEHDRGRWYVSAYPINKSIS